MKKIMKMILVCILTVSTISGCAMINIDSSNKVIIGNGKMVDQELKLSSSFDSILVENLEATVYISPEKSDTVTYTVDDNLLNDLEIITEGSTLSIRSKENKYIRSKEKIKIYVGIDQIKDIKIFGGAVIESLDTLNTDDFTLDSSGACKVVLDMNCKSATISISGAADIQMTGKSETASFTVEGAGKIKAKEFIVDDLNLELAGAATAEVYANKNIQLEASGTCSVTYWGDAEPDTKSISGIGRIRRGE